jgi:hypothetical protein
LNFLRKKDTPRWQGKIFLYFILIVAILFAGWAFVAYLQIPFVHYSVSKSKMTAAFTANGEKITLEKATKGRYEIIYVQ